MDIVENQYEYEQQYTVKPLWNPKYFFILTILFSHIPILIFYIWNFVRLKEKSWYKPILLISIVTFLLLTSNFIIPSAIIAKIISTAIIWGLGHYMKVTQEPLYEEHIARGGKSARYILPIIVSLLFASVVIWFLIMIGNIPENYKVYLDDEVYYTEYVQVEEVDRLGEFLIDQELFYEDGMTVAVKLDYEDKAYHVFFVIDEGYLDDEELMDVFRYLRYELMDNIYPGNNVEIHLTDGLFKIIKTIKDDNML